LNAVQNSRTPPRRCSSFEPMWRNIFKHVDDFEDCWDCLEADALLWTCIVKLMENNTYCDAYINHINVIPPPPQSSSSTWWSSTPHIFCHLQLRLLSCT
jgi:hypothetical protein